MDKRREENLRVKENIINTLFRFMQKKSLSDITVTELVKGAGVARASFYRNYDSKEDVLVTLIRDVLELFRNEMKEGYRRTLFLRQCCFKLFILSEI